MLSPDFINLLEFNDIVNIYEKLNIDLTVDIINRVSKFQDITATTKEQLRIIKQTNGTEIFNNALKKTLDLSADTKKALKELYETTTKEDMQGYRELYEYRDKPFALSERQYRILNQGLENSNRNLKNFTNTIAFASQNTYIEAVDKAYIQAVTGAFGYNKAIDIAVQDLAKKGITLKDKAGRNVQLEVAIRRNVLTGIRETANKMERDIEDYLGCDGYEVTARYGARPTHAEAQGKQYAKSREDAKKYHIGYWGEVQDLWEEFNCRHSYFGIILGISEPVYDKNELNKMQNAKLKLAGKEVPYYEVTQKQRQLENEIRKKKREIQILDKSERSTLVSSVELQQLQKEYTNLCNESGLAKDYNRLTYTFNNSTKIDRNVIMKLPNYTKAIIPEDKFIKYALNPTKDKNKAEVFKLALGYDLSNADKLIENIRKNVGKFEAIEKNDLGYGKRYEVNMILKGPNGKIANVKTAWIIDKENGETRLTSAYVKNKKGRN